MLNKVILMGRLTAEPELRQTANGTSVVSFTLAVDRSYARQGEEKQTDFLNIVAWRQTAEFIAKWFRKGQLVAVSGRIQTRNYEDKQGNKRTATDIVADEAFFAESKRDSQPQYDRSQPSREPQMPVEFEDFEEVDEDGDLPF